MRRRNDIVISTYEVRDGFLVDVVKDIDRRNGIPLYEAFLYHEGYGIKSHMFGAIRDNVSSVREFLNMVERNIDEYIEDYIDEYAPELLMELE